MENLCFLFVCYSSNAQTTVPNNLLFLTDLFNHNIKKHSFLFYNHREPPKRFAHRWVHSAGRTQVLKDLDDAIPPESQWKAAPPEQKGTSADGELLKERTKWNCWLCKAKIKQEPVKAQSVLLLHSIYFGHSDYLATEMKKHVTYCLECVANGQPDIFFLSCQIDSQQLCFHFFLSWCRHSFLFVFICMANFHITVSVKSTSPLLNKDNNQAKTDLSAFSSWKATSSLHCCSWCKLWGCLCSRWYVFH